MYTNRKRKNIKLYNIILTTLTFVAFLSMLILSGINVKGLNISFAKEKSAEAIADQTDTIFMYSPAQAVSLGDEILVLDDLTKSIIKLKDGKIVQGENAVTSSYNASHMFLLDNNIVLLSLDTILTSKLITAISTETLEQRYTKFLGDEITLNQKYDEVSVYNTGNALYILLYRLDTNSGIDSMLYMKITPSDSGIEISRLREINFSSNSFQNNFSEDVNSINILFDENSNLPVCLINSDHEVIAIYIEDNSDEISKIYATAIQSSEMQNMNNFSIICIENSAYVVERIDGRVLLHNLHIPNTSLLDDKFKLESNPITLDISLTSISGVSASGTNLYISSKNDQKVFSITLGTLGSSKIVTNIDIYSNPNVSKTLFSSDNIKLMEITSDTTVSLKATPYSSKGIITLGSGSCVIEIGCGCISYDEIESVSESQTPDDDIISGYKYYMANVNGTNYYGFLPISATSEIITNETDIPYAFAKKNINVYKYPSATEDEINSIIYTTDEIERMEIVKDISGYFYTVGTAEALRTFYCVKINDEIGYIESSDIDRFPEVTLIQTNAEIIRGTAVYAEVTDEIPTWNLIAGKRVRIIENRFGTEKWTKISFNDDDGVTCTGYVLADNIQADSWSTLQIIGFILVLVTLVLLVIILIVRNRINHE